MAEETLDLRALPKAEAYRQLEGHVRAVLHGVHDPIAAMATMSALIHHAFGHLWTGFYRVVEPGALLRVGAVPGHGRLSRDRVRARCMWNRGGGAAQRDCR